MIRTFFNTIRFAAGIAALALTMTNSAAAKTIFPINGGSGDAGFQDYCPANQIMTGLAGRSGTVVDQIQIICSPISPNGTHGPPYYGPTRGGSGGAALENSCSATTFGTTVVVRFNDYNNMVTDVQLVCTPLQGQGSTVAEVSSGYLSSLNLQIPESCPIGEFAIGFAGRYGKNVNALGLLCDARTVASAPAPASAPSAYPIRTTGRVAGTTPAPTNAPAGSVLCPSGLVWREASPTDHVCVNFPQHLLTVQENAAAASHVSQTDHTYGPNTCVAGYVWRGAYPGDAVCVTPQMRQMVVDENKAVSAPVAPTAAATTGPLRCPQGYVWREASPTDHVCVTPIVRTITAEENKNAASHVSRTDHTYGPNTCAQGYVWRAAYAGDAVCVSPQDRKAAADQNRDAPAMIQSH